MRHLIGIFSVLWTLLLCGVSEGVCSDPHTDGRSAVAQPASERLINDNLPNKDLLLSSAQSLLTAGEEESAAPNVRQHSANSRTNSFSHSHFHILRNGKVVRILRHPYRTVCDKGCAGTFSAERYLFALRRIRI
ncbi:MAG: hypothetical protein II865_09085 [Bacteroidales bacterium]|nr:hypothetical protein [Bacteroidales bacterium]